MPTAGRLDGIDACDPRHGPKEAMRRQQRQAAHRRSRYGLGRRTPLWAEGTAAVVVVLIAVVVWVIIGTRQNASPKRSSGRIPQTRRSGSPCADGCASGCSSWW